MKHKNTGSIGHKNTGYNNHTNTYGNHTDTYNKLAYNQYRNHNENYNNYYNYSQSGYGEYGDSHRFLIEEILENKEQNKRSVLRYGDYKQNIYTQSTYTQSGSKHVNTGENTHSNTGYTNHVDINENVEPSIVGPVKDWTSAYYKDTISFSWSPATDNNKCISVVSASYNDTNTSSVGIFENNIKKSSIPRGITIAYWNSSGVYQGALSKDTYEDINLLNDIKTYYSNIPNNSIICMGTYDAISLDDAGINTIKAWLTSLGITTANTLDGIRSAFSCIIKKGVNVLSQQVHRYGSNPVSVGCCSSKYTIPNVSSGQTITYILEYAFKGIGQSSFGTWTRIGTTTSTNYSYNLSNHTNGIIKFRLLSNDGVENATQWRESKEIRILKYTRPTLTLSDAIKATEVKTIDLEIEKLNTATGLTNSPLNITIGNKPLKTDITSLRTKINNINRTLALGELSDKNLEIMYTADIDNIKKNIEKI